MTVVSNSRWLMLSGFLWIAILSTPLPAQDATEYKNLRANELVAWCIVPFDAKKRGPEARAQMLSELGLKRLAYDWREEHVPTWDAELDALHARDIELTAFWCSSSLDPASDKYVQRILEFLERRKCSTQLWIMLPPQELEKIADEDARVDRASRAVRELAELAGPLGCQVGLYNHGGWVGRPANLVKIMQSLDGVDNVGIVYNFHHAHEDLGQFPQALKQMLPYLLCLNLNGTTAEGPKIQTIGDGKLDSQIIAWIDEANYDGPVGILDHRNELDARESLQKNLAGLQSLLEQRSQD